MAHEQFWERLANADPRDTARRARCEYLSEDKAFRISLLESPYLVDLAARAVWTVADDCDRAPAGFLEQLCMLAYLDRASDIPLAQTLVSAEKLEPGGFFFRGSHKLPIDKLEAAFGENPQLLHSVGRLFDARRCDFGDAAIELAALPRIPLTFVIWAADEEFPARASVLFDKSASQQMLLDALYALANLAIDKVVGAVDMVT